MRRALGVADLLSDAVDVEQEHVEEDCCSLHFILALRQQQVEGLLVELPAEHVIQLLQRVLLILVDGQHGRNCARFSQCR